MNFKSASYRNFNNLSNHFSLEYIAVGRQLIERTEYRTHEISFNLKLFSYINLHLHVFKSTIKIFLLFKFNAKGLKVITLFR